MPVSQERFAVRIAEQVMLRHLYRKKPDALADGIDCYECTGFEVRLSSADGADDGVTDYRRQHILRAKLEDAWGSGLMRGE